MCVAEKETFMRYDYELLCFICYNNMIIGSICINLISTYLALLKVVYDILEWSLVSNGLTFYSPFMLHAVRRFVIS